MKIPKESENEILPGRDAMINTYIIGEELSIFISTEKLDQSDISC